MKPMDKKLKEKLLASIEGQEFPVDHPLMVCDVDSPQFEQVLLEYCEERDKIKIANEFSATIHQWLSADEIATVNSRNASEEYKTNGYCATHDFCDPNEAMAEAYKKVTGKELESMLQVDEIWTMAKANQFNEIKQS